MRSPTAEPPAARPSPLPAEIRRQTWAWLQSASGEAAGAVRGVPAAAARRGLTLLRKLAARDPARALALVRRARRVSPGSAFLAQATAILTARARGWAAAAPLFAAPAARRAPGAAAGLLRGRPAPALALALPAPGRPDALPAGIRGADRRLRHRLRRRADCRSRSHDAIPGLRFLLLTDRAERRVPGWETVAAGPRGRRSGAHRRLVPHPPAPRAGRGGAGGRGLALPRPRPLAGRQPRHPPRSLVLWPQDLALWRHPAGIDWRDLAEAALIAAAARRPAPAALLAQARGCEARRLPRDARRLGHRHDLAPPHAPEVVGADGGLVGGARGRPRPRGDRALCRARTARRRRRRSGRGSCRRRSARPRTTPSWRSARRRRARAAAPRRIGGPLAGGLRLCREVRRLGLDLPPRPPAQPRWSPPATRTSTTCATPATSPACATGWWC